MITPCYAVNIEKSDGCVIDCGLHFQSGILQGFTPLNCPYCRHHSRSSPDDASRKYTPQDFMVWAGVHTGVIAMLRLTVSGNNLRTHLLLNSTYRLT